MNTLTFTLSAVIADTPSTDTDMTQDEIQKVQQALMLAEMFFLATPIDTIEKMGNPLGKVLSEAVGITLKYTDQ
ncbi:MAG: hypothetical protein Unbinned4409contig1001_68 [Prokaryotic dsDNA virus sp.]|nr:MAG: hypothetical protein Unbinned4409contig1001_68 [Prokaryotic dsDNA virus sp.]